MEHVSEAIRQGVSNVEGGGSSEGNLAVARWSTDVLDRLVSSSSQDQAPTSLLSELSRGRSAGVTSLCAELDELMEDILAEMHAWSAETDATAESEMITFLREACKR